MFIFVSWEVSEASDKTRSTEAAGDGADMNADESRLIAPSSSCSTMQPQLIKPRVHVEVFKSPSVSHGSDQELQKNCGHELTPTDMMVLTWFFKRFL